ncbi:bifunctional aspartate kinase/homoserine dehydrogenase I [Candidatus Pantoea edessiphila]|uniref:Bifunctional aspartokinase/homoserine dehydrogenase n=1 Tax=Candidatus Pantoea edessiphila TaxID=2044610 RepID=A0A2P5SY42_9GAMM|nr:bifunctional aspartate kinase/homoserine dehydrogenase I [Candidatus Pantoea edessiphila]MBK4775620.1 bifunctional aspartate kinase/homoserine dehydrogenase I [Pantoea sp. Edef]PPI87267.1 bifunctional aspartate kinase/homoserine dehydrogenase I [Candidatus Pantoea edessiphila]
MRVLKFGGTSMEDASLLVRAADILEQNAQKGQVITVLSSSTKITTFLSEIIKNNIINKDNLLSIKEVEYSFSRLLLDLINIQPTLNFSYLKNFIKIEFNKINKMIHGLTLLKKCTDNYFTSILCMVGKISVVIMEEILKSRNNNTIVIDPVKTLFVYCNDVESKIDIVESIKRISIYSNTQKNNIILVAGSIAGNKRGEIILLGTHGSNYSAAALSACFNAEICEIWTDVNGIYSCDLTQVPNAKLLQSISHNEAKDLICFGSKILDLKSIKLFADFNIPCLIKNIHDIKSTGTLINNTKIQQNKKSAKAIVSLSHVAMLNISGPSLQYRLSDTISRIVNILSNCNILLFSSIQNYLRNSINFYISEKDLKLVHQILIKEFEFELKNKLFDSLEITKDLGIISIIGDQISNIKGIYGKIFPNLSYDHINIKTILHNHSKSSISIVTNNNEIKHSVKVIYNSLFINYKSIEVFLIGVGGVGNALLNQIKRQQNFLKKEKNIKICIYGIADSRKALTNLGGINLNDWKSNLNKTGKIFNINEWISLHKTHYMSNPVIIDCTASQEIANQYTKFLSNGFHIVTSNKKANTASWHYYQKIRAIADNSNLKFLYETNVGAGLPVIENLKNLLNSGDQLIKFSGILSGSLSFIFGKLDEGLSISEATEMARKNGFTEPDPREDLSGIDVARKLLIIAREIGFHLELKDINIEPILPNDINNIENIENFMQYLSRFDDIFKNRVSKARNYGRALRFVGTIENGGICSAKIDEVKEDNPLYKVKNGENALAFYSRYYQPIPLVLRGYGAGNDVTAAGVFADLLHTLS